jgi:GT2 family glycosyltransferase
MVLFTIVIPSYNGKDLLKENLPSIIPAIERWKGNAEVLVVDDGSNDGTEELLRREFPEVNILLLGKNQGFALACNAGFKKAKGEIVVLLNNDVSLASDILSRLIDVFKDERVFAVSFHMFDKRSGAQVSTPTIPMMRYGLIVAESRETINAQAPCITFLAHGGGTAFKRNLFIALKGFDTLYSPFYYEDIDLSYRAWGSGYYIYFDPECVVHHSPMSTIGNNYNARMIETIHRKNKILFFWKNVSQPGLILIHLLYIPLILAGALFSGRLTIFRSYFLALRQLPQVFERRRHMEAKFYSDKEILEMFRT